MYFDSNRTSSRQRSSFLMYFLHEKAVCSNERKFFIQYNQMSQTLLCHTVKFDVCQDETLIAMFGPCNTFELKIK